jgi:hypothetical protein
VRILDVRVGNALEDLLGLVADGLGAGLSLLLLLVILRQQARL